MMNISLSSSSSTFIFFIYDDDIDEYPMHEYAYAIIAFSSFTCDDDSDDGSFDEDDEAIASLRHSFNTEM